MKINRTQLYNDNLCKEITLTAQKLLNEYTIMWDNEPKSKYSFSRNNWYEADHRYEDYDEVVAWCTEQFGPRPRRSDPWTRWVDIHIDRIRFRDAKDYEWFMLRWS